MKYEIGKMKYEIGNIVDVYLHTHRNFDEGHYLYSGKIISVETDIPESHHDHIYEILIDGESVSIRKYPQNLKSSKRDMIEEILRN